MLTKTFTLGEIDYRLPNVPQAMRLLGRLGLSKDGGFGDRSEYEVMADLVEQIRPLILAVRCKKGDEEITTYDQALEHIEFAKVLTEIGTEIMTSFAEKSGDSDRKNS
jgi:hypothetical protein